jgi:hypothetical protein
MRIVTSSERQRADHPFSLQPNAAAQPLPEAGAQRTLEAVGCSGLFGLAAKFCLANTLAPDVNGQLQQ